MTDLKSLIREVPDFPKPGINFYDITTLLKDPKGLQQAIGALADQFRPLDCDVVLGVEARGFIFAAPVAVTLGAGFIPLRKPGKLPWKTVRHEYELEYGIDSLEAHADAVPPGGKILIVDDVLATGGTAWAAAELVRRLNGTVVGWSFLLSITGLKGERRLTGAPVHTVVPL